MLTHNENEDLISNNENIFSYYLNSTKQNKKFYSRVLSKIKVG